MTLYQIYRNVESNEAYEIYNSNENKMFRVTTCYYI